MKLPVARQITHISPSSFKTWKRCQYKTYLQKMSGEPQPEYSQGLPAAIGNAFDAFIKDYIAKKRGIKSPVLDLNTLLKKGINEEHREEAIPRGKELAKLYIDLGLATPFLDMAHDLYLELELYTQVGHIPVLGQLDVVINGVPFDWKTRGAINNSAYPHKGWIHHVKFDKRDRSHVVVPPDEHVELEKKNEDWTIQLIFYNWLVGNTVKRSYYIQEICHYGDYISFVIHSGNISVPYEMTVVQELKKMWDSIRNADEKKDGVFNLCVIEEPQPCRQVCEQYNSVCDVACLCPYYAATLGDPTRREFYL